MASKIEKRRTFAGTGMMAEPEYIEELQERRSLHERLIQGKPEKSFQDHLKEKMRKLSGEPEPEAEPVEEQKGAIEPHLGLSPSQDASLVGSGKGRRSGRVIVKG